MRFRLGNRCWQCRETLPLNDQFCPHCGATPRSKHPADRGGTRVGGLLGWLIDNAIWFVAAVVLVIAVIVTIFTYADSDRSHAESDQASNALVPTVNSDFYDPLKAWQLSVVPNTAIPAEVIEIVSGDTFRLKLRGEERLVVLVGIRAPETAEARWQGGCYAEESRAQLREILPVGTLLYVDIAGAEKPGNGPAYALLWFADRGAQRAFLINELIVADGDAVADLPIGDPEVGARIQVAENEARSEQIGLWNACDPPPATPTS